MEKTAKILYVCFFVASSLFAQKHDYIWLSGYGSFTTDTIFGGTDINFNTSPSTITRIDREPDIGDYYAGICNSAGELQFYTNGCTVYGADHYPLLGGNGINPGDIHDEWCLNWGYYPGPGNTIILPSINDKIYYLIHKDIFREFFDIEPYVYTYIKNIYYTKIEMYDVPNSSGHVIEKNVSLLQDTLMGAALTAVSYTHLTLPTILLV